MNPSSPRNAGRWAWSAVLVWTTAIYLTIPVARLIQHGVDQVLGRAAFLYFVWVAVAVGLFAAVRALHRQTRTMSWSSLFCLGAVAAIFGLGTWHLRANPEEAMHFVQYGVLSLLLYRAFRIRHHDAGLYVAAFLLGALIGVVDETMQWITPRRFFDFRDMGNNVAAVALVQVALAFGLRPEGIDSRPRSTSLRVALRWGMTLALFLTAVLSGTPARVAATPPAWGLHDIDEPLIEYGHRMAFGPGLHFASRLSAASLLAQDQKRGQEVGALLAGFRGDAGYQSFLEQYPPSRDAVAHEMRVHMFRRDRYWKLARAQRPDSTRYAELLTVAFREQQILEAFFPQALRASGLDWSPEQRARAEARVLPGPYVSPVSRHLVTRWSERQLRLAPWCGWVALFLWVRYVERRERLMS